MSDLIQQTRSTDCRVWGPSHGGMLRTVHSRTSIPPVTLIGVGDHFDLNLQVYYIFLGAKHRHRSPTTPITLRMTRRNV
jgi:hypothetical protein